MALKSLRGLINRRDSRRSHAEIPHVNGGLIDPDADWNTEDGIREVRVFGVRDKAEPDRPERDLLSGTLLAVAGVIIAVSLAGAGYIAYEAQRLFTLEHNGGDRTRAAIEAGLADAGWAAMALIALVAALKGRSSLRARAGVVLFFGLSLGAQVMFAEPTIEGYLVAVIPPIVLAWMLESFVVEVRRWAINRRGLDLDESPILGSLFGWIFRLPRTCGRLGLWLLRLVIDRKGTVGGAKTWVLETAPIAPGRTLMTQRAAAALEQAGTAEQAAQRARAEALAEVEQIREASRAEIEKAREISRTEVEQIREASQAEIEKARAQTDGRITAMEEQHEARLADVFRQAEEEMGRREAAADQQREAIEEQLHQRAAQVQRLEKQVGLLLRETELLMESATAKARLITLYERLGAAGDIRYLDRSAIAEVARELYVQAGLSSEGTARAYLGEYIESGASSQRVGAM